MLLLLRPDVPQQMCSIAQMFIIVQENRKNMPFVGAEMYKEHTVQKFQSK